MRQLVERILFFVLAIVTTSCGRAIQTKDAMISVEIDNCKVIDCDEFPRICFSEEFIFSMYDDIQFDDGAVLYLRTGNNLFAIDAQNGHVITRFSNIGNGPEEYIQLWDFCLVSDGVLLYDIDKKCILKYSKDGRFISSASLGRDANSSPFQYIFPLNDSLFIGKRIYGMPDVPELSIYSSNFEFVKPIGEFILKSGIRLWRELYTGSDQDILYTRYFSNKITGIKNDSVFCKYSIDFGKYSFDDTLYKDEYECIEQLNKHESRYASLVSNLYEDRQTFVFQFVKQGSKYLTIFKKTANKSMTYKFTSKIDDIEQVIYMGDGNAFVFFSNEKNNGGYYHVKLNHNE